MKSILIIDDHPLVIDGIKTMMNDMEDYCIMGACKTASDALQFMIDQTPDIILMDISLPDMDGLQLCEEIRKTNDTVYILGLTSINETGIIIKFLQNGGNGFLLKNMERDELLEAMNTVYDGRLYLSRAANEKILENFQNIKSAVNNNIPVLTRREKEIVQLLEEGLTSPQIAEKLFLSHYTVDTHRKNLLKKYNANNLQMLLKTIRDYKLL